jgi:hypothetical protein
MSTSDHVSRIRKSFTILAQLPIPQRELEPTQVLVRFCLRMTILVVCAAFSSIGFGGSLAALLWMSIILCTVIGMMKREPPFGMVLNHWDETVAYAALFSLVSFFNHSVPV